MPCTCGDCPRCTPQEYYHGRFVDADAYENNAPETIEEREEEPEDDLL